MEYIVKAYSKKANQTQREINLMSAHPSTEQDAWNWARSFAQRLNEKQMLNTTDWVAQIEQVDPAYFARTQ
jgi:hypothetical protein